MSNQEYIITMIDSSHRAAHNGLPCCSCLCDIQFPYQTHSNLDAFNKSCLLVIPTKGTDGVDNLIDFLQRLIVHKLAEFPEAIDFVTVALARTHMLH